MGFGGGGCHARSTCFPRRYPATGLTREQLIKAKNVDPAFIAHLALLEEEKGAKAGKDGAGKDGEDEDGADEELGQ